MITTDRACLMLLFLLISCAATRADNNWPQWRGPQGDGHSGEMNLPVEWDASDVAWRADLKGLGHSSPVIWGERIFLTSALDGGRQRLVMCLDRRNGRVLWEQVAWTGEPEPTHNMNMHASATCATDGERIVAFFGRGGGLHCFDMNGTPLWSRDLGQFEGPWGTAASPIIVGDLVIQNCDAENEAFLLAVDKRTGADVWRTPREKLRGWSTPIVIDTGVRREIVLNGERGVDAYDPATGKHLWFCRGDTGRGTPTVVPFKDMLIAVNGRPGDMIAVRPGGNGTVNGSHEVWRTPRRAGRDLPSPIVVGEYLFVVNLKPGIASCYDAATGTELSKLRLDGNFSASPIAANGLVYIPSEEGNVYVLKLGKELQVVSRNSIGPDDEEIFRASLTPCDGQIFCRSDRVLYCIGKRPTQTKK